MTMFGNVRCIRGMGVACACPDCRARENVMVPVISRPEKATVNLSRRQVELLVGVLGDYRADVNARTARKSVHSPEYLALCRLDDDVEAVLTKVGALLPWGAGQ